MKHKIKMVDNLRRLNVMRLNALKDEAGEQIKKDIVALINDDNLKH